MLLGNGPIPVMASFTLGSAATAGGGKPIANPTFERTTRAAETRALPVAAPGVDYQSGPGVDLSVVICTFRRPELLAACLQSCLQQDRSGLAEYEIVVVDNDAERSAWPVVEAVRSSATVSLRYVHEPVANIATARNRGVREAIGTFVAFVDDDFVVPPGWLTSVLRTFARSGADAIVGDVRPIFEDGDSPGEGVVAAYTRHAPEREGRVIVQADGYAPGTRSGNAILRRSFCFLGSDGWFDPAFGRSGGEDAEFFLRLGRRRPHIVSSSEAFVFEFVPLARQSEDYLVARAEREGRNYARLVCKNAASPRWRAVDLVVRGAVQIVFYTLRLSLSSGLAPERRLDLRIRRGLARGKAMIAGRARDEPYR